MPRAHVGQDLLEVADADASVCISPRPLWTGSSRVAHLLEGVAEPASSVPWSFSSTVARISSRLLRLLLDLAEPQVDRAAHHLDALLDRFADRAQAAAHLFAQVMGLAGQLAPALRQLFAQHAFAALLGVRRPVEAREQGPKRASATAAHESDPTTYGAGEEHHSDQSPMGREPSFEPRHGHPPSADHRQDRREV